MQTYVDFQRVHLVHTSPDLSQRITNNFKIIIYISLFCISLSQYVVLCRMKSKSNGIIRGNMMMRKNKDKVKHL